MLLFLFRTLEVALCFFSGAGSGFFSIGLFSEKLLESVKEILLNQPLIKNESPITGGRGKKEKKKEHAFANFHAKGPVE